MWSVTLSTAAWVPKVLLTPSMRICAVARGSSHGVSASGFDWVIIVAAARRSEICRGSAVPPLRGIAGPLDPARPHHAALPHELTIQVNLRPHRGAGGNVGCLHHRECEVALAGRRPGRGGNTPRLLLARPCGVEKRIVGRFRAFDVEPHQPTARPACLLSERRPATGEVRLV